MAKAGKMARQVRVLVAKSDNPSVMHAWGRRGMSPAHLFSSASSVLRNHVVHVCSSMCTPTHINTHKK